MRAPFEFSYALVSCKRHSFQAGFRLRPIRPHTVALCYITKGSGTVLIDDTPHDIEPGACFMLQPGMFIEASAAQDNDVHFFLLQYIEVKLPVPERNIRIKPADPQHGESRPIAFLVVAQVTVLSVLEQLEQLMLERGHGAWLCGQAMLYELLYVLHSDYESQKQNRNESIQRTIDFMEQRYMERVQVGKLPDMAGMTSSSYCRAFKRKTGMTPGEYLTNVRVQRAKDLLSMSHHSIKDVAQGVGFQDELYFSRVFKKSAGLSPTIYMKKYGQRIAVVSKLFLQDHLLALGIKPIAAPSFPNYCSTASGFPVYLHHLLHGTKPLNAEQHIHPREVLTMAPDYILKMNFKLNQDNQVWTDMTANTISFDGFASWHGYQRYIAKMVGKEQEAEAVIRNIAYMEEQAKEILRPITRTGKWTIVRIHENDLRIQGVSGHAINDLFYGSFGFQPEAEVTHSFYKCIALSELVELNPERIIILWSQRDDVMKLQSNPLWRELRAARENRVYVPDSFEWDPWGPFGQAHMIRESVKYFQQQCR
ncbi:helix-turn-helix domain-containing protein [Paenibacillus profundus]|uniref:Helix-turn-helix domain-containing protein n=1 Tax=Paenibacillus profundus TaxID=1173085 RepID=A0ABS8YAS9_9BACL|nr:helix-turn-helix domain-containing protein [Paenibacillus profundus]MCE5168601.1 helix-turn-helix domain-containing protein [Paenibacillus profundus]